MHLGDVGLTFALFDPGATHNRYGVGRGRYKDSDSATRKARGVSRPIRMMARKSSTNADIGIDGMQESE